MSRDKKLLKQRVGSIAGIAAPILAFACIFAAIASDSGFSWTQNALSDLGIVPGITGFVFNFGLCGAGLLALVFVVLGLFIEMGRSVVGRAGATVFGAASVALFAIGVFNENFSGIHYAVSVAFFVLIPISLFIFTSAFALSHQAEMTVFTVIIGAIAALSWLLLFAFHYVPNDAIPETVSAIAVSGWIITISLRMLKEGSA